MGCMNFDNLKSRGERALCRSGKILNRRTDLGFTHFGWDRIAGVERNRTRRECLPAAVGRCDRGPSLPSNARTGLPPGVCKLNPRDGPVRPQESNNAREFFDVLVFPQTQIRRGNSSARFDSSGFRENDTRAAHSARCQVNRMPVIRETVFARILAHGRNPDSVPENDVADAQGSKQVRGYLHRYV